MKYGDLGISIWVFCLSLVERKCGVQCLHSGSRRARVLVNVVYRNPFSHEATAQENTKQFRATPMGTVMAFGKGSQSQEVRQNLATGLWKCANLLVLLLNQFFLNVYAISYFPDIEMIPRASTRVISP